jgi:hypothetical protein
MLPGDTGEQLMREDVPVDHDHHRLIIPPSHDHPSTAITHQLVIRAPVGGPVTYHDANDIVCPARASG